MIPTPTRIYHITHVDNLWAILDSGGLWCCADLQQGRVGYTDIAHQHIQDRRAKKRVPCGPGGVLHDYVPFYFAARSPMLYALHKGTVGGYAGGQQPIIHLVSTVQAVHAAKCRYVFTSGHAALELIPFFDNPVHLDKIDWPLMSARYWKETLDDPDRKSRRQAEFLVHHRLSSALILEIGVQNRAVERRVNSILKNAVANPVVRCIPGWYY